MLAVNVLPRIFVHQADEQEVRLADPSEKMAPEAVLNFYAHTYPVLTTAKIEGPKIINDEVQYKFVSTIGTKG